jgi:3-isopropylmalate/(R)-2-methylmalate dehydratase small subunit
MSASAIARVDGRTIVLRGDDIDTDRIVPARFLKAVTFDGLEAACFADDRAEAARAGQVHPFDDPERTAARVLFVESNFGCGSSREHAPQALYRRGIRAIVGRSFAEIFFGNAVAIGLACVTVAPDASAALMRAAEADPAATALVDLLAGIVRLGDVDAPAAMPEAARTSLVSGTWDMTSLLLARYDEVDRVAAQLQYLRDFT